MQENKQEYTNTQIDKHKFWPNVQMLCHLPIYLICLYKLRLILPGRYCAGPWWRGLTIATSRTGPLPVTHKKTEIDVRVMIGTYITIFFSFHFWFLEHMKLEIESSAMGITRLIKMKRGGEGAQWGLTGGKNGGSSSRLSIDPCTQHCHFIRGLKGHSELLHCD